jgi:hypothetical protein
LKGSSRSIHICILDRKRKTVFHRDYKVSPEVFLKAIKPYRKDIAVAVEYTSVWYWLAGLCVQQTIPSVLGNELSIKAMHMASRAETAKSAQQKEIGTLVRGGAPPVGTTSF